MRSVNQRYWMATAAGITALAAMLSAGCQKKDADAKAGGKPGEAAAAPQPAPVDVIPAKSETVVRLVPVTGSIQALQTVELIPKITAGVIAVNGREGETVQAGQVVVQQNTVDLVRQVEQSRANVLSAQAKLEQAQTNYDVQVTNSDATIRDAQEQVRSAKAELELTRRPQRSQEVIVAENDVKQAQANYDKAKSDRERYESLFKEGATAAITLDQYVTQEKVQKTTLDSAKQKLDIAQQGGRTESVRQQEAQVARAQQTLRQAQANRGQIAVRQNDIDAARAALAQAKAALGVQEQAVADASLRSPIDGVISSRKIEPGQLATVNQSVMQLVSLSTVYFEAQINEGDVALVRQGQSIQVHLDAYPGRSFTGTIAKIYPTGSTTGRTFNARVVIPNSAGLLRPGLFARGQVAVEYRKNSITAPVESLIRSSDSETEATIFTVENGVAHEHKVELGLQTPDGRRYEVHGVEAGSQIVVAGQRSLKDGDPVKAEKAPDTRAEARKYQSKSSIPPSEDSTSTDSASPESAPTSTTGSSKNAAARTAAGGTSGTVSTAPAASSSGSSSSSSGSGASGSGAGGTGG